MAVRVVKVGGSLLVRDDVVSRLRSWLVGQAPASTVLIVGGGVHADQVRRLDRQRGLTDQQSHRLAIRAMSLGTWWLSQFDEAWEHHDDWNRLNAALARDQGELSTMMFDAARFLQDIEPRLEGIRLPVGWHVTSDSVAARVATLLQADELVLLKSCATSAATAHDASRQGHVDPFFPRIARAVGHIRSVDLVNDGQSVWRPAR